jgi:general L-amino acid transport system permease protein
MDAPIPFEPLPARAPPHNAAGVVSWLRTHLFGSPGNAATTIAIAALLAYALPPAARWLAGNAVWHADYAACRALDHAGACWGFVAEKWRLILFGRYPFAEQWRPLAATSIVVAALVATAFPAFWRRSLVWLWGAALALFFVLMGGGVMGLTKVDTGLWGGLPLTVLLTLVGMGASIPIGILLALARRSELPLLRALATLYIELVRGVPLITVLFTASFVFPLLLPQGIRVDVLTRIALGIVLFQAAYIAEVVRGGLQALPKGQYEAAAALGLSWWRTQQKVILPQALTLVIPSFVNSLLSTFMDTSLVTIVSMYDLTGALRLALGDAQWRSFFLEGYLFVALIYFAFCFAMSRYSHWLEHRLGRWTRR